MLYIYLAELKVITSIGMDIKKWLSWPVYQSFLLPPYAGGKLQLGTIYTNGCHISTEVLLETIIQQETDCFNATSLHRKESKPVCSPLHRE